MLLNKERIIEMVKVLFVCHGNICRSPMAEFIMKDKVKKLSMESLFHIDSRATSTEEIGNNIYPKALRTLNNHGILGAKHSAEQITIEDYNYFDYIFVMDQANIRMLKYVLPNCNLSKVSLIGEFIEKDLWIEDPWYTDNFELVFKQLDKAIDIFINKLIQKEIK